MLYFHYHIGFSELSPADAGRKLGAFL